MVYHFRGLVKNEDSARELVIEAFEKVSSNIEKFNIETANFSTWLFRLTQNLFIDKLRKRKLDVVSLTELEYYDEENNTIEHKVCCPDETPESSLLTYERDLKMEKIINSLSNKMLAKIIKMRYYEELSYKEIAEQNDCSVGTVKTMLFRAKEVLKKEFVKHAII
jgi:RNA polymerase sigma factor (sigma-70 family)